MRLRGVVFLLVSASVLGLNSELTAQGEGERPQEGHWSCFTAFEVGETIYVAPVWDETALIQEVQHGFQQFLLTKYGYKDRVSCSRASMSGSTVAGLTADNASRNAQWQASGKKVVDTGWTFSPATASLPYLCAGYAQVRNAGVTKEYHFVNKTLRIPGSTQGKLSLAWIDYLNVLHPGYYYQGAGCQLLPAEPTAQQARIDAQIGMYAQRKPEIVRLDWDWQPPSAGAAAAAKAEDDKPAYYCEKLRADSKVWYVTAVYPVEAGWTGDDYTKAWHAYASTLKTDGYLGACESGTMKQEILARATRMQLIKGIVGSVIHEVDWRYTPK